MVTFSQMDKQLLKQVVCLLQAIIHPVNVIDLISAQKNINPGFTDEQCKILTFIAFVIIILICIHI